MNSTSEHRKSCHLCGNIRKSVLLCKECPYIYCMKCQVKMTSQFGDTIFTNGCPVCKHLCCCSSRNDNLQHNVTCDYTYHCYKKCSIYKTVGAANITGTWYERENQQNNCSIITSSDRCCVPTSFDLLNDQQYQSFISPYTPSPRNTSSDDDCLMKVPRLSCDYSNDGSSSDVIITTNTAATNDMNTINVTTTPIASNHSSDYAWTMNDDMMISSVSLNLFQLDYDTFQLHDLITDILSPISMTSLPDNMADSFIDSGKANEFSSTRV